MLVRGENPRQPARKWDHNDLGNQVGCLEPADLVLGRRQPAADVLQGRRNNLDVQQRHETAEAHHHEGKQASDPVIGGGFAHFDLRYCDRVSTLATMERPGLILPNDASSSSRAIRTGTRCTTLVKLPVAFSGGITLKTAPVAGARLRTWP